MDDNTEKAVVAAKAAAKSAAEKLRTGPQTSEFRLTVLIATLGTVLGIYGALKGNDHLVTIGGIMVAGPGAIYTVGRSIAKRG